MRATIKGGTLVFEEREYSEAVSRIETMVSLGFTDFMGKHNMHKRTFVPAVVYAFVHPLVDPGKLIKALNRAPMDVVRCSHTEDQLRNFDELYNYRVNVTNRVYMEPDYKRRLYIQNA